MCGYGSNGMAFCNARKGDAQAVTVMNNLQTAISLTNLSMCSPLSNIFSCVAFLDNTPSTFVLDVW